MPTLCLGAIFDSQQGRHALPFRKTRFELEHIVLECTDFFRDQDEFFVTRPRDSNQGASESTTVRFLGRQAEEK